MEFIKNIKHEEVFNLASQVSAQEDFKMLLTVVFPIEK